MRLNMLPRFFRFGAFVLLLLLRRLLLLLELLLVLLFLPCSLLHLIYYTTYHIFYTDVYNYIGWQSRIRAVLFFFLLFLPQLGTCPAESHDAAQPPFFSELLLSTVDPKPREKALKGCPRT